MGFLKTYVLTTQDGERFVAQTLSHRNVKEFGKQVHHDGGFAAGMTWYPLAFVTRIEAVGSVTKLSQDQSKALIEQHQDQNAREEIRNLKDVVLDWGERHKEERMAESDAATARLLAAQGSKVQESSNAAE